MVPTLFCFFVESFIVGPLLFQLGEFEAEAASPPQLAWQGEGGMLSHDPPQPEHFFQALESNPCLQPTYHTMDMNQQPVPAPGGCYPAWMS
ncbi:MADS24 [Zea mays]|nr:MADS24 [Zea mays]ONM09422.1 MADS24 [Zea mays]